ncbi:alpha-glucosidase [Arthrobacter stackebrandtii]|uniref:Alpha-glucosidase n=2 Tax=Arthrobacter stackebrandtii TaxID=272161 RepID=A0ABS4YUG3_9MICC|nr:glycoside hydrolase family 13 protein [Arthrobacter stackebrandtii]MBP2412062.1 alpha-glucosidase [Arthrobacter stackebrandtii]
MSSINTAHAMTAAASPRIDPAAAPETASHPAPAAAQSPAPAAAPDHHWSRDSVIYQIYPRSFRDTNGDGVGDLAGITAELGQLADLGVDAVWLSPFFKSPQRDGGYDVADYCQVDPLFGTMADFNLLVATAGRLGLRTIIDLVPNHCSSDHVLFQAALAAPAGSPERDMFIFRDGLGTDGSLPPNNWQSHFGGSAWTQTTNAHGAPGQWYLHLFDPTQPDFNWDNPAVHAEFERILRFWLDKGVDGFRVDVAHALVKAAGLPDWGGTAWGGSIEGFPGEKAPMFGQPGLADIYRRWREVLAEYGPDRILCAEANVDPLDRMANWVRPDQMHHAFNFPYLVTGFEAPALRQVVDDSLQAFGGVGATSTWVLSNHDRVRHASRFGYEGREPREEDGVGPADPQPNLALGRQRAAAASLFMLGLPGAAYLYQGEELGLPEHTTLADEYRQDPTFARTGGERIGRDGCRIPLPWRALSDGAGFSHGTATAAAPWLPMPEGWEEYARDLQSASPSSHLSMYRNALRIRRERALGTGSLQWMEEYCTGHTLAFRNGTTVVLLNTGSTPVELPAGTILQRSQAHLGGHAVLEANEAAWLAT